MAVSTGKVQEQEDFTEFSKWLEENSHGTVRIMVAGKKGAGKSSLLNFVFGTKFLVGETLEAGTTKVEVKSAEKNGIKLELFDCPGLEDGSRDEDYLKDIAENCKNIDLVIFCVSMIAPRANLRNEASALSNITKNLGTEIWQNTVVCLTFANMLERRIISRNRQATTLEVKNAFDRKVQEWTRHLKDALQLNNVPEVVISQVISNHICVGGYHDTKSLPGIDDWITEVWVKCVQAMKETTRPLVIQMEIPNIASADDPEIRDYKQQELVDPSQRKLILSRRTIEILGLTAASGTAVATGATIGAVIGTFAIGLPTFGTAAGAGLVIGGAVGAGAGLAVGVLYGIFKKKRQKKKVSEM